MSDKLQEGVNILTMSLAALQQSVKALKVGNFDQASIFCNSMLAEQKELVQMVEAGAVSKQALMDKLQIQPEAIAFLRSMMPALEQMAEQAIAQTPACEQALKDVQELLKDILATLP